MALRRLGRVAGDLLRQSWPPVKKLMLFNAVIIFEFILIIMVMVVPLQGTSFIWISHWPEHYLQAHWALRFLIPFTVTFLFRATFAEVVKVIDSVATKRLGPAYIRQLPEEFRSQHMRSVFESLSSSIPGFVEGLKIPYTLPLFFYRLWQDERKAKDPKFHCNMCRDLLPYGCEEYEYLYRRIEFCDLVVGRNAGCQICAILHAAVTCILVPDVFIMAEGLTLNIDLESKVLTFYDSDGRFVARGPEVTFYAIDPVSTIPLLSTPKAALQDTNSEASMHRVESWIKTCTTEHAHCPSRKPNPLPDRVLDLGCQQTGPVRLYQSLNELAEYACLSHMWGESQLLKTTKANLHTHTQYIDPDGLSLLMLGAIEVCRRLSIRYLWIDTICIVQDDDADWVDQSAKMATIYDNAFLTIAATHANDHNKGLHATPKPPYICKSVSAYTIGNGMLDDVHVRVGKVTHRNLDWRNRLFAPEPEQVLHYNERTNRNMPKFPLLSRAWIFQERLLSPRILYFGPHELMWGCRTCLTCDCGYRQEDVVTEFLELKRLIGSRAMTDVDATRAELHSLWYAIIERYSQVMGNLKYESDVFPALSGIAKRISHLSRDEYVAGLWKSDLVTGLCWFPKDEPGDRHGPGPAWRAPSWSWASIGGPVTYQLEPSYRRTPLEIFARVTSVKCMPAKVEPTSELSAAELMLRGEIRLATIRLPPAADTEHYGTWHKRRDAYSRYWLYWDDGDLTSGVDLDIDSAVNLSGERVTCLRLARHRVKHLWRTQDYYLVLRKIVRIDGSVKYSRLGIQASGVEEWSWTKPNTWMKRSETDLRTVELIII